MKAIILAGGGGTRLWPLSRDEFPKQFIKFNHPHSLLQQTVLRCHNIPSVSDILVISHAAIANLVEQQLAEIQQPLENNLILEPSPRNTAPAIALSAAFLEKIKGARPEDILLILPSDHLLEESPALYQQFESAKQWAQKGYIVTFGIVPTHPDTGYGYIKAKSGSSSGSEDALPVERFVEKPDVETAEGYVASGQYFWNSGMFALSIQTLMDELKTHAPEIQQHLQGDYPEILAQFEHMPNISFDHAVMEKTRQAMVLPLSVQWSDVGSWDSVLAVLEKDLQQNVIVGSVIDVNTRNSLVMNHSNRTIATIGLEDTLIIETPDALLVAKKGDSQQVRDVVERLKQLFLDKANHGQ